MIDLSNERQGANTQKSLFTATKWKELKDRYKADIKWVNLEPKILEELEVIEEVSEVKCIKVQIN